MGNKRPVWFLIVLAAVAWLSYPWVINSCAFHPDRRNLPATSQLPSGVEELFITTDDGERLHCYWLPRPPSPRALIYFQGNSGNMAQRIPELMRLADLGFNVLGAGYRGFGKSTGRPTESGIYRDGRSALNYLLTRHAFQKRQVILLGCSIGSAVAVEIARGEPLGAVILVTPISSGKEIAKAHGYGPLAYFAGDAFDNLSRIDQIRCPLLIVHGTADEVTPIDMGRQLYAKAPEPKYFVAIEGAHHNDIAFFAPDRYWGAIKDFTASLSH